jgi:aspartyl-tRNA(Asn)/glutamyl-tRNA(Gln) amidotransferase subunit A
MMEALAPGFEPRTVELEELEIGIAWLDEADPLVRARIENAAAVFPDRRELDFPRADRTDWLARFGREAAEVHSGLFPEHADDYGEDVRANLERALRLSNAEIDASNRFCERYREEAPEALTTDLLVTPTLTCVAPRVGDPEARPVMTRLTASFNLLGWPALALPCGPAEDGLPASVQLVGRHGEDALVLAAGSLLERALSLA